MDDRDNRLFVSKVLASEADCIRYLQDFGLFLEAPTCKGRNGIGCGTTMRETTRLLKGEKVPVWRCPKRCCRTYCSFSSTNRFFHYTNVHGKSDRKISLTDVLQIVWLWAYSKMTITDAAAAAHVSKQTITDWWSMCREVCTLFVESRPKVKGTMEDPIQVDESYFAGRRKYNRGRLRRWDKKPKGEFQAQKEMQEEEIEIKNADWGAVEPEKDKDEPKPSRNRNYGNRVMGPWVVGLATSDEVRFFVAPDRKGETLRKLIRENCEDGSTIVSDEWKGYSRLNEDGYNHLTVNHSKWFVNPDNGVNTQRIERAWVEGKAVMKRHRHASHLFQGHLDELSFKKECKKSGQTVLQNFWPVVQAVHAM